jgi:predicted transcriptional regulator
MMMSTEVTITLPDDIYRQFESMAEASEQDVAEVVAEAAAASIPQLDVHPRWQEMEREEAAFKAMHKELMVKYRDQYVAIYQGKVVDHDEDFDEIIGRIDETYPDDIVFISKVSAEPERTLRFRSPRLVSKP